MHSATLTPPLRAVLIAAFALLATLALGACGDDGGDRPTIESTAIELEEVNNSGYEGEAHVAGLADGPVAVTLAVGQDEAPAGNFPVAIHQGGCDDLTGQEVEDLGTLENGVLTQEVPMGYDALTDEDHVIILYEGEDRSVFVACGEI